MYVCEIFANGGEPESFNVRDGMMGKFEKREAHAGVVLHPGQSDKEHFSRLARGT